MPKLPDIDKAASSRLSPDQLARLYEGGGLQQPFIDPVDLLAAAGTSALLKPGAAAIGSRAAEFLNPEDALGSTNYLLKNFSFKKMPLVTREGHAALEEAAKTSASAAKKLAAFEKNMHRQNNISMAYSVFDDVDTLLPKKTAAYFKDQLKSLNTRLQAGLTKSATESGGQTKVPTDVVSDLRDLLVEYRDSLVAAGHK